MKWKDKILKKLINDFKNDAQWITYIEKIQNENSDIAIHLAIFSEPLLQKLMTGAKVLESRFSVNKISPFGKIRPGDIVVVKKTGGPIVAAFISGIVYCEANLTPDMIEDMKFKHSKNLGLSTDDVFWGKKIHSKYATLINITNLKELSPYSIEKKDRIGWVVVKPHKEATFL